MARWITEQRHVMEAPAKPKPGKRHPLLIYRQLNEQVFWIAVFTMAVAGGLLIWNGTSVQPYRSHLALVVAGMGLLLVLTFMFRLAAYVQCRADALVVRTPLQKVSIPYEDIRITRPSVMYQVFPPDAQPWNWRHFLDAVYGKTAVVVEMNKLPRPAGWLRLWMGRYVVSPDVTGLVVLVSDWMGLRAEFDEYLAYSRRKAAQRQ